jgi:hypothetical protein
MIPVGNRDEVAYMTSDEWNRFQETYTRTYRHTPAFRSLLFANADDVPSLAVGHLRRLQVPIAGQDGVSFDSRGFVATNAAAEEFLRSRGYVEVNAITEGGRSWPLFLPPLDAQLYRKNARP